ncbi:MAG: V-type ATP synthase subunit D [Planctomycetota bacterium]
MSRLNIPPTKSNILQVSKSLEFAEEGFELLEQKRQILVLELMSRLERAKRIQEESDRALAGAFEALKRAQLASGSASLQQEAIAVPVESEIRVGGNRVMGIDLPTVDARPGKLDVRFGIARTNATSDEVMAGFHRVLELLREMAEIESAVFRLAMELRKTQRRVNALEKIFLPQYRETVRYIRDTLEEREREEMIIMKMIKRQRPA